MIGRSYYIRTEINTEMGFSYFADAKNELPPRALELSHLNIAYITNTHLLHDGWCIPFRFNNLHQI